MKRRVFLFLAPVLGFCPPLSAQVTDVYFGVPTTGSVSGGQSTFYRLEASASGHLVLMLQSDDGRSRHTMYIQRDVLPTADGTVRIFDSNMQQIRLHAPLYGAGRSQHKEPTRWTTARRRSWIRRLSD